VLISIPSIPRRPLLIALGVVFFEMSWLGLSIRLVDWVDPMRRVERFEVYIVVELLLRPLLSHDYKKIMLTRTPWFGRLFG